MKVLSIGNSFSQDAQRYLHEIAKADGFDLQTANLYIGGCSLAMHSANLINNIPDYDLEINGKSTGKKISICQALETDEWDYITLQQASHDSAKPETYFPHIKTLAESIRAQCPKAKIFIHETWAYEDQSSRLYDIAGYKTAEAMLSDVKKAYQKAASAIAADGIIPCGSAMMQAVRDSSIRIHRDTFHAALGVGRYLLSLTWYAVLTGQDITNNQFFDFDEPVSQEEREIVIAAIKKTLGGSATL